MKKSTDICPRVIKRKIALKCAKTPEIRAYYNSFYLKFLGVAIMFN